MAIETIKVYKGASSVIINKTDIQEWNERGYVTSSQRQKGSKKSKAVTDGEENKN